jgi:hypothetical protein
MLDYRMDKRERVELRAAYRIDAVILLGQSRTMPDVADALLFDPDTVRNYFKRYKEGRLAGLLRMSYVGNFALLDGMQLAELDVHLSTHLYSCAAAVTRWVDPRWGGVTPPVA